MHLPPHDLAPVRRKNIPHSAVQVLPAYLGSERIGTDMVNDLINHILPSIEHFHLGGYWIAFFAAFLETTIGIGLFLPGSTIILVLGALSARGYFDRRAS